VIARPGAGAPRRTVTSLRRRGQDRVEVELDGAPWRSLPLECVLAAGIDVGVELDRPRARALGRELRRRAALDAAVDAVARREHTTASLSARLERRRIAPADRRRVLEIVQRAGLVDDTRFAIDRATTLARRGAGDLLIEDDLERHGVPRALAARALGALEPEPIRAAGLLETRGRSARTLRALVARGFSDGTLEEVIAEMEGDTIG